LSTPPAPCGNTAAAPRVEFWRRCSRLRQTGKTTKGETLRVREVWDDNLEAELVIIRSILDEYPVSRLGE
jgi:hypothetical protein